MRYYFYSHGAFMSSDKLSGDPADPQSWNKYTYGLNDPINLIDPSGEDACEDMGLGPCSVTVTTPPPPFWADWEDPPDFCFFNPSAPMCLGRGTGGGPTTTEQTGSIVGIRTPGQTFSQCMAANANTYSLGGFADLAISAYRGKDTSLFSNRLSSVVTGNAVSTLLFGNSVDLAATTYSSGGAYVAAKALGAPLTYGRRQADIMSLNLVGKTGSAPRALAQSTAGARSMIGKIGSGLSFGLSFLERTTIDVAFTAGEAVSCSAQR